MPRGRSAVFTQATPANANETTIGTIPIPGEYIDAAANWLQGGRLGDLESLLVEHNHLLTTGATATAAVYRIRFDSVTGNQIWTATVPVAAGTTVLHHLLSYVSAAAIAAALAEGNLSARGTLFITLSVTGQSGAGSDTMNVNVDTTYP